MGCCGFYTIRHLRNAEYVNDPDDPDKKIHMSEVRKLGVKKKQFIARSICNELLDEVYPRHIIYADRCDFIEAVYDYMLECRLDDYNEDPAYYKQMYHTTKPPSRELILEDDMYEGISAEFLCKYGTMERMEDSVIRNCNEGDTIIALYMLKNEE
jgi:hypothetical protein